MFTLIALMNEGSLERLSSYSNRSLSPPPAFSSLCALSVSAFSPLPPICHPERSEGSAFLPPSSRSGGLQPAYSARCSGGSLDPRLSPSLRLSNGARLKQATIPFRMIFFAHLNQLTPIESYSCKKQGRVVGAYPDSKLDPNDSTFIHSQSTSRTQESPQLQSLHGFTS
jgi:hypothetical protein